MIALQFKDTAYAAKCRRRYVATARPERRMRSLQAKNCCVVTQQFDTAYAAKWGPRYAGGAAARPERLFK